MLAEDLNKIINYKDVLDVATELCRTVINDQKIAKSTYCLLHEWTKRIRIDKSTQINFVSVNTDSCNNDSNKDRNSLIATTVTHKNKRKRDNRFISALETQRTFGNMKQQQNKNREISFYVKSKQ